jgi:transcriptional regulator of acetoin/glycerol metabolism
MREEIERKEKELMCHALMSTAGNKTEAALLLGMPRSTFYEKIKKYNLRLQLQAVLQ